MFAKKIACLLALDTLPTLFKISNLQNSSFDASELSKSVDGRIFEVQRLSKGRPGNNVIKRRILNLTDI